MTVQEKKRWTTWADELRQEMMTGLTAEVTKSVAEITSETGTTQSASKLGSVRFWRACQAGDSPNDFLARAGFEIDFQEDEEQTVRTVTLRLNQTWMTIQRRVLDRKKA